MMAKPVSIIIIIITIIIIIFNRYSSEKAIM